MQKKTQTFKEIVRSFGVQCSKVLLYIALHIIMIGMILGGCYLTGVTILKNYMLCLEFTLGALMAITGVVMIYTFIRDVIRN